MVKNKTGGNKNKKRKNESEDKFNQRELITKDDGQEYAQVIKLLGNSRMEVKCFDGTNRLCHIRGTLKKKKIWILINDIILVSVREFEDNKCDALIKYNADEVKKLKKLGEIPDNVKTNEGEGDEEEKDIGVDFRGEDDTDEDNTINLKELNIDEI